MQKSRDPFLNPRVVGVAEEAMRNKLNVSVKNKKENRFFFT